MRIGISSIRINFTARIAITCCFAQLLLCKQTKMLMHGPSVAGIDLYFSRPVSYKLVQSLLANCQSQFGHSDDRTYFCYFYIFTYLLDPNFR